jgi:hypothetical protein
VPDERRNEKLARYRNLIADAESAGGDAGPLIRELDMICEVLTKLAQVAEAGNDHTLAAAVMLMTDLASIITFGYYYRRGSPADELPHG